jgi:hypothetical protein
MLAGGGEPDAGSSDGKPVAQNVPPSDFSSRAGFADQALWAIIVWVGKIARFFPGSGKSRHRHPVAKSFAEHPEVGSEERRRR